ncbi:class I SAM-dependent methyltransferase, partial [Anaerosolibacter sp.]|uniref:class I SAM-dependent methyltransferase n=1 Tax=Anaerosolibacter sp. TaxID=1872527 RepID=UPI0039EF9D7C
MKIDLGCGTRKQPGYIGLDRTKMPGVDIICDLNDKIPLEDDTVEYVIASHSLEHVDNLISTMEEIYRVCKHKARICIVAPYYNTSLNIANPYHKQVFNEHTPRFFTSNNQSLIPSEDYAFPHAKLWGLGQSDHSNLKMDFRCLAMEFFYFPPYRNLPEDVKRELRNSRANVVDQIMYQLLVVKQKISDYEIIQIAKSGSFEEPNYVTIRRLNEKLEDITNKYEVEIKEYQDQLEQIKTQFEIYKAEVTINIENLQHEIKSQQMIADDITKKNV